MPFSGLLVTEFDVRERADVSVVTEFDVRERADVSADAAADTDTMLCGIPCGVGYHAVRDTMPCGIPCRVG